MRGVSRRHVHMQGRFADALTLQHAACYLKYDALSKLAPDRPG